MRPHARRGLQGVHPGRSPTALVGPLPQACVAIQTELPAWGTYFFICPYGPAELWNVKKYVFQVGNSHPQGRPADRQPASRAGGCGWGEGLCGRLPGHQWTALSPTGIVLSLCLCQQVEAFIRH